MNDTATLSNSEEGLLLGVAEASGAGATFILTQPIDPATKAVVAGSAISIPAGETHQVRNTSEKTLRLLCMIPK